MQSTVIGIALIVLVLVVVGWWLLVESEGVYLGKRIVVWLYDVYAARYDSIKRFRPDLEGDGLAGPLVSLIDDLEFESIRVLDVATGTGRLQSALAAHSDFTGVIVGVDASRKMLAQAHIKQQNGAFAGSWPLLQMEADRLAFPDASFEVVTCLEALEFFPDRDAALRECMRVLKPGGLLFLTNRKGTRLMPGRTQSLDQAAGELIDRCGLTEVKGAIWQADYDQIWGYKG